MRDRRRGWVWLAVLAGLAGCGGLDRVDQGNLQPQSVSGPCRVSKFFLLGVTVVHTEMVVGNAGASCGFTLLNPDLQAVPTAALITTRPVHGTAMAAIVGGGRQVEVRYTPQAGYVGEDPFVVTIEPADHGIAVAVRVQSGPP